MKIRNKLTLQFSAIVTSLLFLSLAVIYLFSAYHREAQFYERLDERINRVSLNILNYDIYESGFDSDRKVKTGQLINECKLVFDSNNNLVYKSQNNCFMPDQKHFVAIEEKNEVKFTIEKLEVLGEKIKTKNGEFYIFVAAEDFYGRSKLKNLRIILVIVFFIISFIAVLSGRYFAKKSLDPILRIVGEVDEITVSNLNKRVNYENDTDEIATLARTFNKMLERLEDSFLMQEYFVANASHEIRTPLTLISGQLEILLNKERTTEYYKQKIISVSEDIKRLTKISDQLILLANVSKDEYNFRFEQFRIDELIWQLRSEIISRDNSVTIDFIIENMPENEELLFLSGNEILLKSAFSNLIENSIKYSNDRTIRIILQLSKQKLRISFNDNGIGIPKDEINNIFQAFYRASNAIHIPGNGIGLSIVDKIVKLHSGNIEIKSALDKGTSISVVFNK